MARVSGSLSLHGAAALHAAAGQELGVSDWHSVAQSDVDSFAQVTGDDQWIHTDSARAATTTFGGTIVHGFLVLALGSVLASHVYTVSGFDHALNYGLGNVRFPAPLPVGTAVRLRVSLTSVVDRPSGVLVTAGWQFERNGHAKPVCVASKLTQFMGSHP